jgi:hypothetical protein
MSTIATIDLQPRSITLTKSKDGAFFEGNFKLSLTNVSGKRFNARVEVRPDGNVKAEWIEVDKALLMFDFEVNKVQDIPIRIKVPATQPEGTYGFMTRLVDTALPDERDAKLPGSFEVPKVVAPPVEKKPLPKWLIPVIAGVVLLLAGGGVGLAIALKKPGLGSKCDPAKPECPESIACDTGKRECLAAIGQACEKDDHCLTNHCDSGKCGPLVAGDECEPAAHLCAEKLDCSEQARRCVGTIGAKCAKNEECVTNKCSGALCAGLAIGETCNPARATLCAQGLVCPEANKKCLADLGTACTGNSDCVTNRCDAAKCAPSRTPPGQPCGANFACGDPMLTCDKTDNICRGTVAYVGCATNDHCFTRNCRDGRCVYPEPGAPCTGGCPANQDCVTVNNGSFCLLKPGQACDSSKAVLCSSQVCNVAKQCAPHDGSCHMASDCPSIASCQGGTCKVPNGRQCLRNNSASCESGFCISGFCRPSPCGTCPSRYYCEVDTKKCMPLKVFDQVIRADIVFKPAYVQPAALQPATLRVRSAPPVPPPHR